MIRVGFSMHPNWARGHLLQEFLDSLRRAGLTALEFELVWMWCKTIEFK